MTTSHASPIASSPWRDPSYLLDYAEGRIVEGTDVLEALATRVFRFVVAGGELDFGTAWDRLFLAGVQGGLNHLVCQERIGQAVAHCGSEQVAA